MSSSLNLFRTEWFAQQKEFTTELESMEIEEMNNCSTALPQTPSQ